MKTPAALPTVTHYTRTAIALHWLMAVLIVGAFGVGFYMSGLAFSMTRLKLYNWHKWTGVTILALAALRLLWRLTHRPPAHLAGPAWQTMAARGGHGALYALFFAVPLFGWAYSSAAGFPIVWFGVLPLPDFVSPDRALAEAIKPWHGRLAYLLAAVVVVHVLAALQHHFITRDGLLRRMWPARG